MMQILRCKECGGETIGLDETAVNVEFTKSHHCDKCYHSHEEITRYFFCSTQCFHCYIRKVVNGAAVFS